MPRKKKCEEDLANVLPAFNKRLKSSPDSNTTQIKDEIISVDSQNSVASTICTLGSEDSSNLVLKGKVRDEPVSKLTQLRRALEINIQMRQLLVIEIDKIKLATVKNLEKQAVLKNVLAEDKASKAQNRPASSVRAISVFAAPYFRDTKRMVPPLNEDTIIKRKNCDVNAYLHPPRPWHREENRKLLDGVTSYALMSAIKPYKIRRDHIKSKLKNKSHLTDEDVETLEKLLTEVELDIKEVSARPLHELLDELQGNFDWMTISSVNMQGARTPEECEALWNNFLDFSINKEGFDDVEDEKLRDLAEEFNERDWDNIAKSLKTSRTAIQCFERYQTKLSSNLMKRYWTKEEDKRLIELVDEMRVGKIIPWNKVCLELEGRTRQQVINRYERSISQAYNRGPWVTEEDALLIGCVHKFDLHWSKMKPFFKRRSAYSIRERYVNALDPNIKMGYWTKDEDRTLITLIKKYGYGKWSKICKQIPGRTDNMCLVRAGRLLEHSVKYHNDRGKDIDMEANDPVLFASILKPLAPTKFLLQRNTRLKSCRDEATETFLMTVQKVVPSFVVKEANLNSYDFSFLNTDILHQISDELHRMLEEREGEKAYTGNCRYFKKIPRPLLRKPKPESEYDSADDVEVFQEEEPPEMPREEKMWLQEVLSELFKMISKVLPLSQKKAKTVAYNKREQAEATLFKAYLYKQFQCQAICDDDDDLDNVVFKGIDYSETLQTVVSYFIQPPIYENQFIVLAPNMTTIGAMEYIEATEDRLKSMSELVKYSTPYMDYISERTPTSPTCLQCISQKNIEISSKVSPEIMISNMREKYFIVDDTLKKAAHVESACHELCDESCCCDAIAKSRNSVRLLRKRFMGLFLWPALLASTKFSRVQENILCTPCTNEEKNYYLRMSLNSQQLGQAHKRKKYFTTGSKKYHSSRVSKRGKNAEDVIPKMEFPESSNAVINTEASCSYILPPGAPCPNRLLTEAPCSNSLPTEAPCSNNLPTEAPCSNSLPAKVPCSNSLAIEASCSSSLSAEASCSNNLPTVASCSNNLPTVASCSNSLHSEPSCSNSLRTKASCSYSLPTEASCSYSLPTEASCSYSLPTEASCSYHLVPHIKKTKTEPPFVKKKCVKSNHSPPLEIRKSKRTCVLTRKSFAFVNSSK